MESTNTQKSDIINSRKQGVKLWQSTTENLKLSDEIGVKKAAEQPGLSYYTLADWRKLRKIAKTKGASDSADANKRIKELEKEIAALRRANDILKDALGFFAEDRKK